MLIERFVEYTTNSESARWRGKKERRTSLSTLGDRWTCGRLVIIASRAWCARPLAARLAPRPPIGPFITAAKKQGMFCLELSYHHILYQHHLLIRGFYY